MTTALRRAFTRALVVASIAGALVAVDQAPEVRAESAPAVESFVMTAFPHDSTAVPFWDSWGAPRSGGRRHQGTDIMSPRGTEIVAVADGVVTHLGVHRMSGYFVRIDHGGGWSTTAMHLNNDTIGTDDGEGGAWTAFHPTLAVGMTVEAGDVIGYVGESGNAEGTQPHTHFELKYEGQKINPYPFLADVWERQHRSPAPDLLPH